MRRFGLILAILIGVPLLASRVVPPRWVPLSALLAVALLARLPNVSEPIAQLFEGARNPSPRARRWIAILIWALSIAYLGLTVVYQNRDPIPRLHDEHAYLIQSRMIAAGRLWMPPHPLADFFDNFYMLSKPVYAPIYFPGTALLNAPSVKLGVPYWTMPLLAAGLVVALTYLVATVMIDGIAGLLAAVFVISNWSFREFSTVVMAQVPMSMFALLMICAYLAWRKEHRVRWSLLLGVFAGWAAIIRPVDAIAFAVPIGLAIWFDLRKGDSVVMRRLLNVGWVYSPTIATHRTIERWASTPTLHLRAFALLLTFAAIIVGALPFLSLQAIFNHGTTGSWLKTPYMLYLEKDQPGSEFGYHPFRPDAKPASVLLQKRLYLEDVRMEEIRRHTLARAPWEAVRRGGWIILCTMPTPRAAMLALFLPAALFGLSRRRWVVFAAAPLFLLLYLPNPFFLIHYCVPLVPVMAFSIALAVHVLARGDGRMATFFTLIVAVFCIGSLPEFNRDIRDGTEPKMRVTALAHHQLARATEDAPAVVLFRFRPGDNPVEDPVYNDDVIWPDDARVIRAHDLGPRNIEIASYYASRQPQRKFYVLDRQENAGRDTLLLQPLGTATKYLQTLQKVR